MEIITDLLLQSNLVTEWITNGLVGVLEYIVLWLNDAVYSIASGLFDIFFVFAKLNLFSEESFSFLHDIIQRVMLLMGLFMMFKLLFSFLTYLVSPDKMFDKSAGAGVVVKNLVVVIILLASVNFIFNTMGELQNALVESQFMSRVIIGSETGVTEKTDGVTAGQQITYMIWLNFFLEVNDDDPSQNTPCSQSNSDLCEYARNGVASAVLGGDIWDFGAVAGKKGIRSNCILSLIGGIFLIYILISFILDVGVRAFKLVFLQMIAPIPIISYIEPKTQKNLQNWAKITAFTFLDLFVRLGIILLAMVLISNIPALVTDFFNDELHGLAWAVAFFLLIISILIFAKALPGLLKDIFGFDAGGVELNPFKKAGFGAITGGLLGTGAGAVMGSIVGARDGYKEGGWRQAVKRGLGGAFAGGARGLNAGRKSQKAADLFKNTRQGIKNQTDARNRRASEGGYFNRLKNDLKSDLKVPTPAAMKKTLAANKAIAGLASAAKDKSERAVLKNLGNVDGRKYMSKDDYIDAKSSLAKKKFDLAQKKYVENSSGHAEQAQALRDLETQREAKLNALTPEQRQQYDNLYNNEDAYMNGSMPNVDSSVQELADIDKQISEARNGSSSEAARLEYEAAEREYYEARKMAEDRFNEDVSNLIEAARNNDSSVDAETAQFIRSTDDSIAKQANSLSDLSNFGLTDLDLDTSKDFKDIERQAKANASSIELNRNYNGE